MNQTTEKKSTSWWLFLTNIFRFAKEILQEYIYGIKAGTLPWTQCFLFGSAIGVVLVKGWDVALFARLKLLNLYPWHSPQREIYGIAWILSGSCFWGLLQVILRHRFMRVLGEALIASGLRNNLGRIPAFISDQPIDSYTRKLRLTRALMPKSQFDSARSTLESALQVHIDEIREHRESGTLDIIYSHAPMATVTKIDGIESIPENSVVIGASRSGQLRINFQEVPHILVAGQTGGGKSTFLRQLISTLYVRNPNYQFSLIDLKGGLEFSLFDRLPRVKVIPSLDRCITRLAKLEGDLEQRMQLLATAGCKDIDALHAKRLQARDGKETSIPEMPRHILVIDEISELFLTSPGVSTKDIQKAREVLSRIARQGRAVGINIVLGTQRPDARALDTQIKANLPGKLCFQMGDTASSMVVLNNSRARDLPGVPGRAIWQFGLRMTEVQTPLLETKEAEDLIKKASINSHSANRPHDDDNGRERDA